jgi:hypothetical protein
MVIQQFKLPPLQRLLLDNYFFLPLSYYLMKLSYLGTFHWHTSFGMLYCFFGFWSFFFVLFCFFVVFYSLPCFKCALNWLLYNHILCWIWGQGHLQLPILSIYWLRGWLASIVPGILGAPCFGREEKCLHFTLPGRCSGWFQGPFPSPVVI